MLAPARRRRTQAGSAVVDLVLALVVVVPLLLGVLQVALVLHVHNTLTAAASEGARFAATADRPLDAGVVRTREQIADALASRFARDVAASPATVAGAPGVRVRVVAEVPPLGLWGPAVLLLVPLVYVVLAVFEVQRGAFAATAAARAAGRAYVLAPTPADGETRARVASRVALADQGIEGRQAVTTLACRPACLVPGSVVHVRVRHQVSLPLLPHVLGDHVPSIRVEADHTVPYGTFREDRS